MSEQAKGWGGARANSGRKKLAEPKIAITTRVSAEAKEWLNIQPDKGQYIERLILQDKQKMIDLL